MRVKTKTLEEHPILKQSFAIIDQEVAEHALTSFEYAIARRVIHTTADFDYLKLLQFSPTAIAKAIRCIQEKRPIVVDVNMVYQGIINRVTRTFNNPVISAVDQAPIADPGLTRTETGINRCFSQYPDAIYVIGNAPTALLALCQAIRLSQVQPGLVIGVPVGFVSVLESKQALASISIPQIIVSGRKGGSTVASAIVNALLSLAWDQSSS